MENWKRIKKSYAYPTHGNAYKFIGAREFCNVFRRKPNFFLALSFCCQFRTPLSKHLCFKVPIEKPKSFFFNLLSFHYVILAQKTFFYDLILGMLKVGMQTVRRISTFWIMILKRFTRSGFIGRLVFKFWRSLGNVTCVTCSFVCTNFWIIGVRWVILIRIV